MNFDFDLQFSPSTLVGVDEVGRGPWAGPVYAACAYLNPKTFPMDIAALIKDSKMLTAKRRDSLFADLSCLPKKDFSYTLSFSSVEEIDRLNILQASKLAMVRAANAMRNNINYDTLLVDGNQKLDISCANIPIVKGDSLSISIAAAGIVAKVVRDQYMKTLSQTCPHYDWENNMGYGTPKHQAGLKAHGITKHHRRSFKPIQKYSS